MKDLETIADQIEVILSRVMADADAVDPAPVNYFMISNQQVDDHWVLGFVFGSKEYLRMALENGVCYQIHDYVFKAVSTSENLRDSKSYIVFDEIDALPETDDDQIKLHAKFIGRLNALQQEREGGEFISCGLCGHSIDEHSMRGHIEDGKITPKEGWMICANKECTCFRTWSLEERQ